MAVFPINRRNILAGFQWFFFVFPNTLVIPPTFQSVFQLPARALITWMQYGLRSTGLARLAQALCGSHRTIMVGSTWLWWSIMLTATAADAAYGAGIDRFATSLTIGNFGSSLLIILIGVSAAGHRLATRFNPPVMVFFMLLLGVQLTPLMLNCLLPMSFGVAQQPVTLLLASFGVSLAVLFLVLGMMFLPRALPAMRC